MKSWAKPIAWPWNSLMWHSFQVATNTSEQFAIQCIYHRISSALCPWCLGHALLAGSALPLVSSQRPLSPSHLNFGPAQRPCHSLVSLGSAMSRLFPWRSLRTFGLSTGVNRANIQLKATFVFSSKQNSGDPSVSTSAMTFLSAIKTQHVSLSLFFLPVEIELTPLSRGWFQLRWRRFKPWSFPCPAA